MDAGGLFGMSAEEIYENFQSGQGGERLAGAADIVRELADEFSDSATSIAQLMGTMESAWQGDAAGAANRGAGPMVIGHAMAVPEIQTAQDLSHRQVGSFGDAKNTVVPVPPYPDMLDPWQMLSPGHLITHEQRAVEHLAASQHNVDVMTGYEGATAFNTDGQPSTYGSIAPEEAGIAVAGPTPAPAPPPRPGPAEPPPVGGPGPGEHPRTEAPAPGRPGGESGPAAPGHGPPQSTSPDSHVPPGSTPSGSGAVPSGPGGSGLVAGPGVGLGGGLVGGGVVPAPASGSDGAGRGPGAGGAGGGVRGGPGAEGGRGSGAGPRGGAGPLTGGAPAGEGGAAGRGGSVAGGRGAGAGAGVPLGGVAGRPSDGEDSEHTRPEWLEGGDPEDLFGTDEKTAPPVIGVAEVEA